MQQQPPMVHPPQPSMITSKKGPKGTQTSSTKMSNQPQIKIRVNKGGGPVNLALANRKDHQPSSIIVHVGLPPETVSENERNSHTDRKTHKKGGVDTINNKSSIVNYIEFSELNHSEKQNEMRMN